MPGQIEAFERLRARFESFHSEMRRIWRICHSPSPQRSRSRSRSLTNEHERLYQESVRLENGEIAEWARQTKRDAEAGDEDAKSILGELWFNGGRGRFELRGVGMPYEWTPRRVSLRVRTPPTILMEPVALNELLEKRKIPPVPEK